MNIILKAPSGGIFSIYHHAIRTIFHLSEEDIDKINSFKIVVSKKDCKANMFDILFDVDKNITCDKIYRKLGVNFFHPEQSPFYKKMKMIVSKNKINPQILSNVNHYIEQFNINENTLGVHLRLTDMNTVHRNDYGIVTFDDFITEINIFLLKNKHINNIFLACECNENIVKFVNYYKDKIDVNYIKDSCRVDENSDDNIAFQIQNMSKENFVSNIFTEMLTLSKCSYLIHRYSDFANFAKIYSNTFEQTICINPK